MNLGKKKDLNELSGCRYRNMWGDLSFGLTFQMLERCVICVLDIKGVTISIKK